MYYTRECVRRTTGHREPKDIFLRVLYNYDWRAHASGPRRRPRRDTRLEAVSDFCVLCRVTWSAVMESSVAGNERALTCLRGHVRKVSVTRYTVALNPFSQPPHPAPLSSKTKRSIKNITLDPGSVTTNAPHRVLHRFRFKENSGFVKTVRESIADGAGKRKDLLERFHVRAGDIDVVTCSHQCLLNK